MKNKGVGVMPETKEPSKKETKMRKIDQKYMELSAMSDEEFEAKYNGINKAITSMSNKFYKSDEEKEAYNKKIKDLNKEKELMYGFKHNKAAIDKAREYKEKMETNLKPLRDRKVQIEKNLKTLEKQIKSVDKKLNVKDPSVITNEEYNALQTEKEEYTKQQTALNKELAEIETKLQQRNMAISKCDMIYTNLMYNNHIDQIHAKAARMSYYAKHPELEKMRKATNKVQNQNKREQENYQYEDVWSSEDAYYDYLEAQEKKKKQENNMIIRKAFRENHPRIARMMDFFSNIGNKIKNTFKKKDAEQDLWEKTDDKQLEPDFTGKRDEFVEKIMSMSESKSTHMSEKGKESLKEIRKTSNELAGKGHKDDEER